MLGSLVDCHNDACYYLLLSSDGFGGIPHQLYQLPARGPLAIKIWAVLLYHGHIVSSSRPLSCHFFLKHSELYFILVSFPSCHFWRVETNHKNLKRE